MRILILFIDMVRTDLLNVYNEKVKVTPFDKILNRIGGTIYTNCYTPAPDTSRSNACMQTGLYPYYNGTDSRVKRPEVSIKDDVSTFFDEAIQAGYVVNVFLDIHLQKWGLIRCKESPNTRRYHSLYELGSAEIANNTITFVGSQDLHFALDDYGAGRKGHRIGYQKIKELFDNYLKDDYISKYDHFFIYSDHGVKINQEFYKKSSQLDLLNNGRTKILMFHHQKNNKGITVNNRLSSITDVYSSVIDLMKINQSFRHGYSFFQPAPESRIVLIEDHKDFSVEPNKIVCLWRAISDRFDIRTDIRNVIVDRGDTTDIEVAMNYLKEYSPTICDYMNYIEFRQHYQKLKATGYYFVGGKRLSQKMKKYRPRWPFIIRKYSYIIYHTLFSKE